MRKFMKIGTTLALICAVAASTLALINGITAPAIAQYEQGIVVQALSEVSNGLSIGALTENTGEETVASYYRLTDQNGSVAGYILQLKATGYGGSMSVMASYDTFGEVLNAKLLANAETPGLGKKAENKEYMGKFIGTGSKSSVPVKKTELDKDAAESVGGATVTFSGIAKAISQGSAFIKTLGGK
ncbi:MAG: FMN-binding protein [Spirochaetae bacterium HGW-Spirochaetae-8]|jgi:electron transport complex protein RnfG|nr:MAG: FMN-binding protein [Spirochaetae bacterium HGW-Spirochaetae-8]